MKLGLRVGETVTDSFSCDTVVQPSIIQEQNYVLFYVLGRQWVKSVIMESARER
jgi:predicted regulator of Ras-like GTPase activity (Roadblock/LC7/MglB family)